MGSTTRVASHGRRSSRWLAAVAVGLATLLALLTGGMAEAVAAPAGKAAGVPAAAAAGPQGGPPVTVMTRNLYLGSELGPVFEATNQQQLVVAASQIWANVLASDFPARAEVLAEEVARDQPLLIGLQEVSRFSAVGASGSITIDFLDILLDALAARGLSYEAVSVAPAFQGTLPAIDPTLGFVEATLLDRDVILARTDVPPAQLTVLDEATGLFDAALTLPLPGAGEGATLRIDRGWQYVDVRARNREFRFVNSHFEAFDPGEVVRVEQARELLAGPLATDLPVVLVGDFNSNANADGRAYGLLTGTGGFADVWSLLRPGEPGLTCCHPADLRGDEVTLRSRIDLILVRGDVRARDVEVIGVDPALRTPSGLWPSDHAGVVARLMITGR
ncbi:endonuclease/exonuclease/phosphatase family protein [Egicoccus sp. AB-alg2]|uniref:endonuclease/exonuclease/phosphatase family protein n=1 Tax=Egicoccus sp. AB-alg2 TaxID=3242693 RepID=UPI00359E3A2B